MYNINDIRHLHLEISSRCNAACPLCPRNLNGYPFNDGYVEHDMTLIEAQKIFSPTFLKNLDEIYINGNFGDAVMNLETIEIVDYFRAVSDRVQIIISTNAGARNADYWKSLARSDVMVVFCIDGLQDTHSIYRQNTLYKNVIRNAKIFIAAGGRATWKMIDFDHNRHQQDTARELSQKLGFERFQLINHGRDQGPVFNKKKQLVYVMGKPPITDFDSIFQTRTQDTVLLEDIISDRKPSPISCQVKSQKSLYVSSTGDVYPCCYLGFNPKTYGHGHYHEAANKQFSGLINENNALIYDLAHCLEWFFEIEKTWNIPSFEQGRLVICNDVCGKS